MPKTTTTVRELKNDSTGIDMRVVSVEEKKGVLFSSTFYYQVVVVTNLPVFKGPKQKGACNVQFTVEKTYSDFESLAKQLSIRFSGTLIPALPRKARLSSSRKQSKEFVEGLDSFVRCVAAHDKLSTSGPVLEFLEAKLHFGGNTSENLDQADITTEPSEGRADQSSSDFGSNVTGPEDGNTDEKDDDEADLFSKSEEGLNTDFDDEIQAVGYHKGRPIAHPQLEGVDMFGEKLHSLYLEEPSHLPGTSKLKQSDSTTDLFDIDDTIDDILSQVQLPAERSTDAAAAHQASSVSQKSVSAVSQKSVSDETKTAEESTASAPAADMDEIDIMKYISETSTSNDASDSLF